jgi:hydroxyacylglutathione hydrolase
MTKDRLPQELRPNIFLLRGVDMGSHSYLIRGDHKYVLIDPGLDKSFSEPQKSLLILGIKIRDIDMVVNTHEHFDHMGPTGRQPFGIA